MSFSVCTRHFLRSWIRKYSRSGMTGIRESTTFPFVFFKPTTTAERACEIAANAMRKSSVETLSPRSHCYLADQTLRNSHRCSGIVYKTALDLVPTNRKTGSVSGRQWADFELLSAFLAKFQYPSALPGSPSCFTTRSYSGPERSRNFWLRRLPIAKNRVPATAITAMTTITTRS